MRVYLRNVRWHDPMGKGGYYLATICREKARAVWLRTPHTLRVLHFAAADVIELALIAEIKEYGVLVDITLSHNGCITDITKVE